MRAYEAIRYNDGKGTVESMTHTMYNENGVKLRSMDYEYTYGDPAKGEIPDTLYALLTGGREFRFSYDTLGRLTGKEISLVGKTASESYTYKASDRGGTYTTTLVESMTDLAGVTHTYEYDANGNIVEESYNGLTNYYYYDSQNRLIRAHDAAAGKVYVYTYDNRGNILTRKTTVGYATPDEWDAAGGEAGVTMTTQTYTYGNSVWADLLTNIGGAYNISYDELGNPLSWNSRGSVLTWDVRNLVSYKKGSKTYNFEYNADGLRTKKYTTNSSGTTTKSTEYYIVNGTYIGETTTIGTDTYTLSYFYDENGAPAGLWLGTSVYYFAKNLQGDVTAIIGYDGSVIAKYAYNVWGDLVSVTDANGTAITSETHIAILNPFRYRGYMYDEESGFYYLRSRYYDPFVGRFLNADNVISGTSDSVNGYNPFVYCFNNPINMEDSSGHWAKWIKKTVDWVKEKVEKVVDKVKDIKDKVEADINNYDKNNTSEEVVFKSNYFSAYKGKTVIKTPFDASFSYGIIGLSYIQQDTNTLRHEYGHTVQMDNLGVIDYTLDVAIPSVTINILERNDKLKYDYYGAPWEAEADLLGGVNRSFNNTPWPEGVYSSYWDLIEMFFE